ncbi:MAG: hypothetical protein KDB53_12425, partial [Planctomycetes bacterium]|nr:hypothetical protein [Planctomycetota bacterium]
NSTIMTPIRFADVELVNANTMQVMQTGATDGAGAYSFTFPPQNDSVFVRVIAATDQSTLLYRIRIRMSTGAGTPVGTEPIWSRASANFSGTTTNTTANWTVLVNPGSSTTANFDSAPFNILDIMQKVQDGVRSVVGTLPQLHGYVTPNQGDSDAFYGGNDQSGAKYVFIGGGAAGMAASSDTNFFDDGVIGHEFGHFLESAVFKVSSYGGYHEVGQRTIPNVAYGEGFGTWVGGVALNTPLYADAGGFGATTLPGFTFNLESEPVHGTVPHTGTGPHGIYDEIVVFELLWDIVDGGSGPVDTDNDGISIPLSQVITAMASFTVNDFITIESLLQKLDSANGGPIPTASLTALMTLEQTGLSYPPVGTDIIPTPLTVGGAALVRSIDATSAGTPGPYPADCYNVAEANAFFSFVATSTSHQVFLDHVAPNGGNIPNDLDVAVLNPNNPFTDVFVEGGTGVDIHQVNATGLTVGNTYIVWVRGWTSSANPFDLFGSLPLNAASLTTYAISVQ